MKRLSLIVAVSRNRVIGRDNALPWRLPEDMALFRQATTGHVVVMGRKTYESIGRPLPERRNIVVTRQKDWRAPGVESAASLEVALACCDAQEEVFLIGGAELYREGLLRAERLLITEIDRDFAGDVYFPDLPEAFHETSRTTNWSSADPTLRYDFVTYER